VHHVKPPASRDESVELYLLAKDFKGDHRLETPSGSIRFCRRGLFSGCSL
jgi:23S rRNA (uridine2552-2'-O)-methyltransferase